MKKFYDFIFRLGRKTFGGTGFARAPLLRDIKHFLYGKVQPAFVELDGLRFYLDTAQGIRPHARYQKSVVDVFRRELKRGDVVVDLGANIGYFTCIASRLVGNTGRVFAFEPEPASLALLAKNIGANNLTNVTVVPAAATDVAAKVPLFRHGPHSSSNFSRFGAGDKPVFVDAVTLDDFFRDVPPRINLIKMDIIGSEAKAFRGMKNVLTGNKNIKMVFSFTPKDLRVMGDDPKEFLSQILGLGFRIYDADNGFAPLARERFDEFIARYSPREGLARANLFCAR